MAFNYTKLKERIEKLYGNQTCFARELKVSKSLISLKLSGKVGISQEEVVLWSEKLNIPSSKISEYFFS